MQLDVFQWLRNVPWERIGVWLVVVVAALNLKDFFGVRPPGAACLWMPCSLPAGTRQHPLGHSSLKTCQPSGNLVQPARRCCMRELPH